MLYDYQREEMIRQYRKATEYSNSDCPLLEDEVFVAMCDHISELEHFVSEIATDWVESSHDKVVWQRNDYIIRARKLRETFEVEYQIGE